MNRIDQVVKTLQSTIITLISIGIIGILASLLAGGEELKRHQ